MPRLFFAAWLLHTAVILLISASAAEGPGETKKAAPDADVYEKPLGWNTEALKEENSAGTDREKTTSNEETEPVIAEALSSYGDYYRYGYSRNDYYSSSRYGGYSWSDRYGYRSYDLGKIWREPKHWTDFSYRQYYSYPGFGNYPFWPRQDNQWSRPEEDEWNFASTSSNHGNKVDRSGTPDQPYGYSDQAVTFPGAENYNFSRVNVSAYHIYKERCCQGKTYPKYPNGQYSCCGSSDYDTLREICCDGKVYPQLPGYECCAEKYINTDTDICCYHPESGIVTKRFPTSAQDSKEKRLYSQCCGEELYDTRSHVCFLVTSRDSEMANFTVVEKKYNHTGCCEGEPYDQDVEGCDETEKTYTFLSGPPCVFKQAYEILRKAHNARHITHYRTYYWSFYGQRPGYDSPSRYRSSQYLSHCKNKMYDPYTQMCCGDRYNEEEHGTVKIWERQPNSGCCGTELFNYETDHCCNGSIIRNTGGYNRGMSCCGKKVYDFRTHQCCDNSETVIEATRIQGDHCCGPQGLSFNRSTHVCCSDHLAVIPKDGNRDGRGEWGCCRRSETNSPGQAFSYGSAKCCNGVIFNLTYDDRYRYECCDDKIYDYRVSRCCGGKVYHNSSSCCRGKEAYNSNTHQCCGGAVVAKPSSQADTCCGKQPYDYQLQTCCADPDTNEWHVTFKKSRNEKCCGGKAYDSDKHECCGGTILISDTAKTLCCDHYDKKSEKYLYAAVDKKPSSSSSYCCGLSSYDGERELCCNGNVISDIHRNATCCGSKSYDASTQLCCYGEVHDRSPDDNTKCCGKRAYDLQTEICCRGVVLPVTDVSSAMCCYENDVSLQPL